MKTVKISKAQQRVVVNTVNVLGLMARDKQLPRAARELLRTTHRELQQVTRAVGLTRNEADPNGFRSKDGIDHQWPVEYNLRWEALK